MVTVIVPVYNTQAYLAECLDSLVAQTLRELEIICVDDGSSDGSDIILARYAAADPRVRVLTQANAGQGAARNHALDLARGEYLTFCDSDDTVPPDAYATMLASLRETGSDFVIGAARRFHGSTTQGISFPDTHQHELRGTNLEEFPLAIRDIIACNRLIRRDFWDAKVGRFPQGQAYEDHVPMLMCTALAERFDVLTSVTYNWRNREDGTSTSQQKQALRNLQDRIDAVEAAKEALWATSSRSIQQTWLGRVLDMDLPMFLAFAVVNDDEYRARLAAAFRWALDLTEPEGLHQVRHARRVVAWLAAQERWKDVDEALVHFHHLRVPPAAVVRGSELRATDELPFATDLPENLRPLAPMESALQASVAWVGLEGPDVVFRGAAVVGGLHTVGEASVEVAVVFGSGDRLVRAKVSLRPDPELDVWMGHHHTSYLNAGFTARLPLAELAAGNAGADAGWRAEVEVRAGEFFRSGEVNLVQPHSAAVAYHSPTAIGAGWEVHVDTAHGLVLRSSTTGRRQAVRDAVLNRAPVVVDVVLSEDELTLTLTGSLDSDGVRLTSSGRVLEPLRVERNDGQTRLVFPTVLAAFGHPALPLGTGLWDVHPRLQVGEELARRLPYSQLAGGCRVTLGQHGGAQRSLRIQLARPLPDEARSAFGDQQVRRDAFADPAAPHEAIVFWTAQPDAPADVWWALDAAVVRQRPELPRYWGVHDLSVAQPSGAQAVLIGSPRWYELLATCRYVVGDLQAPDWARKNSHQRWWHLDLDVHDAPVGAAALASRGVTPHRQAAVAKQENSLWDVLVTASPRAQEIASAGHRWEGRAEILGDPRGDDLVDPERSAQLRRRVRHQLGLDPEAPVLLYLPERRIRQGEDLARRATAGELPLAKLAEVLGKEWTVLRHGAKWRGLNKSAQLREVSDFRPLAHLMAAADVAIVERTEARFLWALTSRPCVVHVPGATDDRLVQPPVSLADSLPGPLVGSLAEALARLSDLDALAQECRQVAAPFRDRWHPTADGQSADRIIVALLGS